MNAAPQPMHAPDSDAVAKTGAHNRAARAPDADTIPAGQRLVRVGGEKGLSLAEKAMWRLRQFHYRSFLHGFKLRGRFPLKLLAAPPDLWPGNATVGRAVLDGRLDHIGVSINTHALRFSTIQAPAEWMEWMHAFRWLRDVAAEVDHKRGAPIVEALIGRWLEDYAKFDELAWRPDLLGERIINWMLHAPYLLSSSDQVYRSAVLNNLARSGRHLMQTAEKTPDGLARIKASAGLTVSGLLLPGGDHRMHSGALALEKALAHYVLADGGIASRCPDEHLAILQLLLTVQHVYQERQSEPPAALVQAIGRMGPALRGLTLSDGHLTAVHSSSLGRRADIELASELAGMDQTPLLNGAHSGFQRLEGGNCVIVMDAGPPPPGRIGGRGHAGTLAFEFSEGQQRIVVNCGGARATPLGLARDLRDGLRTTAAHSTLVIEDKNSTRIKDDGALGAGVHEVMALRQNSDEGGLVEASHDGYVSRYGLDHMRRIYLSGSGEDVRGEDLLMPAAKSRWRRRLSDSPDFTIRFHLGSGIEATPTADKQGALLKLPGGKVWAFKCRGAQLSVEPSLWISPDGKPVKTQQCVLTAKAGKDGASVRWTFKAGPKS